MLVLAASLKPNSTWYPGDALSKLELGDLVRKFFRGIPDDPKEPHMPLVSEAVAGVLQPRIDMTMLPAAYVDFKGNWTSANSATDRHLEVLIWYICNRASKNCIPSTAGTVTFDDSSLTVTIVPPEQSSWHRVAQLQSAVVADAFKEGFVVGA